MPSSELSTEEIRHIEALPKWKLRAQIESWCIQHGQRFLGLRGWSRDELVRAVCNIRREDDPWARR